MEKLFYQISEIAKAGGIHPNTVRMYESWGYFSPIQRRKNGYRQFERVHVYQVQLIRMALKFTWKTGGLRENALEIIFKSAERKFSGSHNAAVDLHNLVTNMLLKTREAMEIVKGWMRNEYSESKILYSIGKSAGLLDLTADTIRNWERNGLLKVDRDPENGYRIIHASAFERLKVIKVLRQADFSMMSILRMLLKIDRGTDELPEKIIDTPGENEDIIFATDQWISHLTSLEVVAVELVKHLSVMKQIFA